MLVGVAPISSTAAAPGTSAMGLVARRAPDRAAVGSTTGGSAASLLLDECDPAGYVPCNQEAAFLSVPVADTGLSLTYSSQWAPGRTDRPDWDASKLGLGGLSVNVLEAYDASQGILVGGDGTWRFAPEVPASPGEKAVPSYNGTVAYIFNSAGQQVRAVDGHLGTTLLRFAYGPEGYLSTLSGTLNGAPVGLRVRRAPNGTPIALVGIDGAVTSLTLGPSGDLVALRGPGGPTTKLAWQAGGLVSTETGPGGGATHFHYGPGGFLVSETDPDGVTQRLSRSGTSASGEVRDTTELGRVSTYITELSGRGVRRTYIAPGGATTTEVTQSDGSLSLSLPDGTISTLGAVPSTGWGLSAPVLTPIVTTVRAGPTSRTEVDQHLRELDGLPYVVTGTVTTTVNGERSVETFEPGTRTTTLVDAAGATTTNIYGSSGLLIFSSAPGSPKTTYAYDSVGRVVRETIGAGRLAATTRWAYNASTRTVTMTRADRSTLTETVNAAGNPTAIKGPNGAVVIETYNADGLLTQVQPPGGATYTLGYTAAGRPTAFLPPSVSRSTPIETATYDRDGDLKSVSGLGSKPVTLDYNAAGELTGLSFDQGTATASYNATTGQLSQAKDPDGVNTTFGYSGGLPDKISWSGPLRGSVTDSYDANGLPVSETVDGGPAMSFAYDAAGNLAAAGHLALIRDATSGLVTGSTLGVVHTAYDYDANDWLVRATTTVKGRTVLDLRYGRDALGRVTSLVETGPAGPTTTTATDYKYNSADLLSQVIVSGRAVETDSYDPAGNRTALSTPAGNTSASYNADNALVRWGQSNYGWAPNGDLARVTDGAGTTSYTFDDLGRLRRVTLPDGESITYLVDAQGQRVGRVVDGRLVAGYLYGPSGDMVARTNGAGAVVARYGYDQLGHLAVVEEGGYTYDVVTGLNGSPLLVVNDKSGAIADAITYNAWGEITSETAPGIVPFGFDGGLVDPTTGLVHLGARDYDPTTGRWTAPDPIGFAGGDADLYRFAADDPVNNADPTGLQRIVYFSQTINRSSPPPPLSPPTIVYFSQTINRPSPPPNAGSPAPASSPAPSSSPAASSYGDTHLTTGSNLHYDFQAAGEFTAIKSPDRSIDVQVRQQPSSGETWVTFATAVAADVNGDRVGVYALEPWFLRVNGAATNGALFSERLPHGGTVARNGDSVTVRWPNGSELAITLVDDNNLSYNFIPGPGVAPNLTGLLGTDNTSAQLVDSNGATLLLSDPTFEKKLYSQFANSWRISQAESLFEYRPGESTAQFTKLRIPYSTYTVASLSASARARAEVICAALGIRSEPLLDDCVLDVGVTGDPGLAAAEAQVAATTIGANSNTTTRTRTTPTTGATTASTTPWVRIDGGTKDATAVGSQLGLARTAGGTLNVVWNRGTSKATIFDTRISSGGKIIGTTTVATNWSGNGGLALLSTEGNTLQLFAGGGFTGSVYNGVNTFTAPASGAPWAHVPKVSWGGIPASGPYLGATVAGNGQAVTAWPGSYHVGLGPSGAVVPIYPDMFSSELVTDQKTGSVVVSGVTIASTGGTYVRRLLPAPGPVMVLPSSTDPRSSGEAARTGAGGVYIAWADVSGQVVKLTRYQGGSRTLAQGPIPGGGLGWAAANVFAAPGGRLWVVWWGDRSNSLFVTRSNEAVSAFEPVQTLELPDPSTDTGIVPGSQIQGNGLAGPLDLFADTSVGNQPETGFVYTRVRALFALHESVGTYVKGAKTAPVKLTVLDAGDPVRGVQITVGRQHALTGGSGSVTLQLAPGGSYKASATAPGYIPDSISFIVPEST
jgi:RHS repeat-associated protein